MSNDSPIKGDTIKVHPTKAVSRSQNFGTLASDFAKAAFVQDTQMCTITFFQSHPIPKHEQEGLLLDSIEDEMVLEVKIPFSTAFALGLYITKIFGQIRSKPESNRIDFGPTRIRQVKEPSEKKT
jgi:hypothetical protein